MTKPSNIKKCTLDRFGRVIIPKAVREDLHLTPGTILNLEKREGVIVLEPVWEEPPLRKKEGILVFTGQAEGDLLDAVENQRQTRDRRVGGLGPRP